MKVMVDYLTQDKRSGRYQYRRRVPKELKAALGKREIVVSLKTADLETALKKYRTVHEEVQRRLDTLSSSAPELAEYQETIKLLRDAKIIRRGAERADNFGNADMKQRLAFGEYVEARAKFMSEEELHKPLNEAPIDLKRVLWAMQKGIEKPNLRLRDALDLYLKEKTNEWNEKRQRRDSERAVKTLEKIVGELNPALIDLTKDDAYAFRDYWLERGNSPETARRRLNTIKALINLSIKRQGLSMVNPFMGIEVKGAGKKAKEKRVAVTVDELRRLQPFVDRMRDQDAKDVWTLMVYTGARPGELATLCKDDLVLDAPVPHIFIRQNSIWRVKTESSDRCVPLVGPALEICKRRLKALSKEGDAFPVFRKYGRRGGPDNLSANLVSMMKRAGIHETRRKVPYSVRHAHEDWVRREAGENRSDLIHGHSDGRISRDYGSDKMLDILRDDIEKALRTAGVM